VGSQLNFRDNSCASARLQVWLGKPPEIEGVGGPWFSSCGGDVSPLAIIQPSQLPRPGAIITVLLSAESQDAVSFALRWTALRRVSSSPGRLTDSVLEPGSGDGEGGVVAATGTGVGVADPACGFVCPGGSGFCVPAKLVCNGVNDCPPTTDAVTTSSIDETDESLALCSLPASPPVDWWPLVGGAAGAAGGIAVLLIVFVVVGRCRCCRQRPRHIDVPY